MQWQSSVISWSVPEESRDGSRARDCISSRRQRRPLGTWEPTHWHQTR